MITKEAKLSFSFLKDNEIFEPKRENDSFFKQFDDSLLFSLRMQDSTESKQTLQDPPTSQENFFDLSISRSFELSNTHKNLSINEETLPTRRILDMSNNLNFSNLALSIRLYCKFCESESVSIAYYENTKENWWNSFCNALKNIKCCNDHYKSELVLVHRCKNCGNVLAKIFVPQDLAGKQPNQTT